MRFGRQVVELEYLDVPMIGNLSNGSVVGLTHEGHAVCSKMFVSEVSAEQLDAVDNRLLPHLEQSGFFVDEPLPQQPTTAYLHVTQNCNLSCVGCYSLDNERNVARDATFEALAQTLDQLASHGVKRLIVSGGEPFLRADLPQILEYAKSVCAFEHLDVLTNGTRLTPEVLTCIAPFVDRISVSFDGPTEKSAALVRKEQRFAELIESIEMIKAAGINAHLLPTLHAKNIEDIEQYFELAESRAVTMNFSLLSVPAGNVEAQKLVPSERDLARISEVIALTSPERAPAFAGIPLVAQIAVRPTCGAGRGMLSVSHDGKVYPCHMLHDDQFLLGSLLDDDLDSILLSKTREECTDLYIDTLDECPECALRYFCGGGCRARAYYTSGSLYAKDPYCTLMKSFYDYSLRRLLTALN